MEWIFNNRRIVINYIISNEEKVVYMKVRELAEEVHVSTTTILRFCKKVGCEGYSEFRLKLKQEVSSKEQKKINMDLTAVKDFFERVQTQAFAENIQEAVKLLTKASSIIFVGVGNSSIIGKYGARYFNNVGWFSFAIDDPFTPVFRGKGERTATIALSVSGETEQTLMLAEKLKRRGSSLISITNKANCSLAKMSDCNINYYVSEYKKDENYDQLQEDIVRLSANYRKLQNKLLIDSPLYKELTKLGNQNIPGNNKSLITEKRWKAITNEITTIYPELYNYIYSLGPNLPEEDFQYCCLYLFGFDTNTEAKLLNIAPNSVSKKRSRLKLKLNITFPTNSSLYEYLIKNMH